jgi:hypothetical protein
MRTGLITIATLSVAVLANAQTPVTGVELQTQKAAVAAEVSEVLRAKIEAEQGARMAVSARITKGAPYSAQTVTESVQALADGNRIVKRTTTQVYRDGEGRTRTESEGTTVSPAVFAVGTMTHVQPHVRPTTVINISDPVSGYTYMLYPDTRTAVRNGVVILTQGGVTHSTISPDSTGVVTTRSEGGSTTVEFRARSTDVAVGSASTYHVEVDRPTATGVKIPDPNATTEQLGTQVIEGVTATGTRTTTVIEAGAIGNEQPIRIVSEQWYSPDLKTLVLTKYSDPRSGDTTFRLTNIVRAEPDSSLFVVPSDYSFSNSVIKRDSMR